MATRNNNIVYINQLPTYNRHYAAVYTISQSVSARVYRFPLPSPGTKMFLKGPLENITTYMINFIIYRLRHFE